MSGKLTAVIGYLANLIAAAAWALCIVAGALAGVDRRRSVRVLVRLPAAERRERTVEPPAVNTSLELEREVREALVALGAPKGRARSVAKTAADGSGQFDAAFNRALKELGYPGGVQ